MNRQNDAMLLRRLTQGGDPAAFAEITRLYSGLVYGTCLRITGDAHHAADAAQETFFQLLRNARRVSGSLAGWLHRVAARRAVDLVRSDAARRRREQAYADAHGEARSWNTLCPLVDEALDELDAHLREILLRHYLQGQTMSEIAATQGVSQPTVSRRVEEALEQMRGRLRKKGVVVTGAILGTLLPNAATTAPAAVMAQLGKMALTVSGAATGAASGAVLSGAKLAAAAVILAVGVGSFLAFRRDPPPAPPATVNAAAPMSAVRGARVTPLAEAEAASTPAAASPPLATANTTAEPAAAISSLTPPNGVAEKGPSTAPPGGMGFGGTALPRMGVAPDPSTPEGAVHRLASALARGDPNGLQKCFAPGTTAYEGLRRILDAPKSTEERDVKQCLESLATPVEVLATTVTDDGLKIKWHATVRRPFTTVDNGIPHAWQKGDRFELETRLKQVDGEWKIISF